MRSKRSQIEVLAAILFSAAAALYAEYLAFWHLSWTFKTPGDYLAFYFLPDTLSTNALSMLDLRILVCFVVDWTCCFAILFGLRVMVRVFSRVPKPDKLPHTHTDTMIHQA